ncbi:hypothetical protein D3C80_2003480 [compost metagenome]
MPVIAGGEAVGDGHLCQLAVRPGQLLLNLDQGFVFFLQNGILMIRFINKPAELSDILEGDSPPYPD